MNSSQIASLVATIAADKKATRIVVLDLQGTSDICEHMVVCSGSNDRQTRAIAQAVEDTLKVRAGMSPLAVEGKQNGHWILLDYGGILVHVFFDYLRDYYAIESLWPKAKFVQLQAAPALSDQAPN
jgi:ribosome-associated protein